MTHPVCTYNSLVGFSKSESHTHSNVDVFTRVYVFIYMCDAKTRIRSLERGYEVSEANEVNKKVWQSSVGSLQKADKISIVPKEDKRKI